MKATGRHLLVEYHNCNRSILNDLRKIRRLMTEAAKLAGATVVGEVFHPFSPQGVSGVVVIEESHLSIHTWPEHGYAAVDFFTCGECIPERAHEALRKGLEASDSEIMMIKRGLLPGPSSLEIVDHERDTLTCEKAKTVTSHDTMSERLAAAAQSLRCSARR